MFRPITLPTLHAIVRIGLVLTLLTVANVDPAFAQLATSKLYSLLPLGGRVGATTEVRVTGGEHLYEPDRIWFNHPGIEGRIKTIAVAGTEKPVYGTFVVTIGPTVEAGRYDVRVGGAFGLSNPRTFVVDRLPEIVEREPNNRPDNATSLDVNGVAHGVSDPAADEDYYRFVVRAGQRIDVLCEARALDSRMDPELTLLDAQGVLLASGRPTAHGDIVVQHTAAAAGEWRLRVADQAFRGGSDYFYRLKVSDDSAGASASNATVNVDSTQVQFVPPQVSAAAESQEQEPNDDAATAQALNLPADRSGRFQKVGDGDVYAFDVPAGEPWVIELFAQRIGSAADPFFLLERIERDAAGRETAALVAEVDDRPASGILPEICNLATDDPAYNLVAPSAGRYRLTVRDRYYSSRGDAGLFYHLSIRREQPDFELLALPLTQEDRLDQCVRPQAMTVRASDHFALALLAVRRDGFAGPIDVEVAGLPTGVTTAGAHFEPKQSVAYLVLSASSTATAGFSEIKIQGLSGTGDVHTARELTTLWDGTREQRAARTSMLSVIADPPTVELLVGPQTEFRVAQGSQVMLPLTLVRRIAGVGHVRLEPYPRDEYAGITIENAQVLAGDFAAPGSNSAWARLQVSANQAPGIYRTHLKSFSKHSYKPSDAPLARAQQESQAAKMGTPGSEAAAAQVDYVKRIAGLSKYGGRNYHLSPVLTVTVEPAPFSVTASARDRLQPNGTVEVPIQINRTASFAGPVRIELASYPTDSGIAAEPIVIAADSDSAVLRIVAAGKLTWQKGDSLAVRATTMEDRPLALEVPLKLEVSAR